MTRNRLVLVGTGLIVTTLTIAVGFRWGAVGLIILACAIATPVILWVVERWVFPRIPELTVAVVYNRERRALARLLWPGRHFVIPLLETVTAHLNIGPDILPLTDSEVRSADGVPYQVNWSLVFELAPENIPAEMIPGIVRILTQNTHGLLRRHVADCLRLVLGRSVAGDLCGARNLLRLSRQLRDEISARLHPFGVRVHRLMLEGITPPAGYQQSLTAAQQRQVQAEAEANALSTLQKAVHAFTDGDIERLAEFERLRVLGKNGVTLIYPLASLMKDHPTETTAKQPDTGKVESWRPIGQRPIRHDDE